MGTWDSQCHSTPGLVFGGMISVKMSLICISGNIYLFIYLL